MNLAVNKIFFSALILWHCHHCEHNSSFGPFCSLHQYSRLNAKNVLCQDDWHLAHLLSPHPAYWSSIPCYIGQISIHCGIGEWRDYGTWEAWSRAGSGSKRQVGEEETRPQSVSEIWNVWVPPHLFTICGNFLYYWILPWWRLMVYILIIHTVFVLVYTCGQNKYSFAGRSPPHYTCM